MRAAAHALIFVIALFHSLAFAASVPSSWLCKEVHKLAKFNPNKNFIAFLEGVFRVDGPLTIGKLHQPCNTAVGVGMILGLHLGTTPGQEARGPVCNRFVLLEFVNGTFHRFGEGGYDNWCFEGWLYNLLDLVRLNILQD